jgi:DNA mismatch repair protein MutS
MGDEARPNCPVADSLYGENELCRGFFFGSVVMTHKSQTFQSILTPNKAHATEPLEQRDFLRDLNLDQVIQALADAKAGYDIAQFFWMPQTDLGTILFRQEVMRDLEEESVVTHIKSFCEKMTHVRRLLAMVEKVEFTHFRWAWMLEAALEYCEATETLGRNLADSPIRARGLLAFREWLEAYVKGEKFRSLAGRARRVKDALSQVRYTLIIETGKFKVKRYEGEEDYGAEIERTFDKFRQWEAGPSPIRVPVRNVINHVEAKILEFVAKLYPRVFAMLEEFYRGQSDFVEGTLETFHREIQFYISYLDFISGLKLKGLPFCYPTVTETKKEICVREGFDLALAHALRFSDKAVVLNDFHLDDPERIIVVTGPNQGGKTTFARMVGQLHYLASLGLPVPAREAKLFLCDRILTHFGGKERVEDLRGKLEDELLRIRTSLSLGTSRSLFILNEILSSTSLEDSLFLSRAILDRLLELDAIGVWVTFLDELSSLSSKIVSMVATVEPHDPTVRTFKVVRKEADGLAYALSLARKYGLVYEEVKKRIAP